MLLGRRRSLLILVDQMCIPRDPSTFSEGDWRLFYVGARRVQSYLLRRYTTGSLGYRPDLVIFPPSRPGDVDFGPGELGSDRALRECFFGPGVCGWDGKTA